MRASRLSILLVLASLLQINLVNAQTASVVKTNSKSMCELQRVNPFAPEQEYSGKIIEIQETIVNVQKNGNILLASEAGDSILFIPKTCLYCKNISASQLAKLRPQDIIKIRGIYTSITLDGFDCTINLINCEIDNNLEEHWELISDAPSFTDEKGVFPAAKYYIDKNSLKKDKYNVTLDMKQVLSTPLPNNAKTLISRSMSINCRLNEFQFKEVFGYDSDNKFIGSESLENQIYPISEEMINANAPVALVKNTVCKEFDLDLEKNAPVDQLLNTDLNELRDQLISELKALINNDIKSIKNQREREQFRSLLIIVNELVTKNILMQNEMEAELSKYKLEEYLTPKTLVDKKQIVIAQTNLINIRQLYNNYEYGLMKVNSRDSIKEKINAIRLDDKLAKDFWNTYETSHNRAFELMSKFFQIERDILNELYAMFGFMHLIFDDYYFVEDQIFFKKTTDLEKYNSFQSKLNTLANKETEVLRQIEANLKHQISQIQKIK